MTEIRFYQTEKGKCPVEEFLDSLESKVAQKIIWVLKIVEEMEILPSSYFKKIKNTQLYECRIIFSGNIFRILCFFEKNNLIILTHGFQKKTQKTPKKEIEKAIKYMNDYKRRLL